ncbi:MFS monocarboxylate transporter [Aspergillus fumigatus]|nr:MFS monocarboxylate transporter [Aspergillus fumigatus]
MSSTDHEIISLSEIPTRHSAHDVTSSEIEQPSLPPADGGKAAWQLLASCCLIQLPVWGFSTVFGIFQEYYSTHDALQGNKGDLATVGTTSTGLLYLLSPVTFTLLTRYPRLQGWCIPTGLCITVIGSLLSSFSTHVWHLIATQGIMCAIGNALMFSPSSLYMDQWFIHKKGLALGIMWAAKSVTGVVLPFAANFCLHHFGSSTTFRVWTVTTLLTTLGSLPFMKPRISVSPSASARRLDAPGRQYHPKLWILLAVHISAILFDRNSWSLKNNGHNASLALQRDFYRRRYLHGNAL